MATSQMTFLVTGSSGNVGGEVVRALLDRGAHVRALVRAPQRAPEPEAAELVTGDLNDPQTIAPGLDGAQGLFLLPGYPAAPAILAMARAAGVRHVVQLSGSSAELGESADAISAFMARAEAAVRSSGLAWTIVRPSAFMSNTLQWAQAIRAGEPIRAPFPDVRAAMIDPADIGAVVAAAFADPAGHAEHVHRLSGPQSLRPADRVEILASVLGRRLRFEPQSDDEARAQMTATMPAEYVDAFFQFYAEGTLDESPVLPTVSAILDRPARTFAQWATANRTRFS